MTTWADKMIRQNQQLQAEVNQLKKELAEARAVVSALEATLRVHPEARSHQLYQPCVIGPDGDCTRMTHQHERFAVEARP